MNHYMTPCWSPRRGKTLLCNSMKSINCFSGERRERGRQGREVVGEKRQRSEEVGTSGGGSEACWWWGGQHTPAWASDAYGAIEFITFRLQKALLSHSCSPDPSLLKMMSWVLLCLVKLGEVQSLHLCCAQTELNPRCGGYRGALRSGGPWAIACGCRGWGLSRTPS